MNDALFSGPIFTSTSLLGINGYSINAATNLAGFYESRVLMTPYGIGLNFQGLGYATGVRSAMFAPLLLPAREVVSPAELT